MYLHSIDWTIIILLLGICFLPSLFFAKKAGKNTSEFFVSGRSVPWWLAGLSMVATTFSCDTPNLVADIVRRHGVAGNWCWWAFTLTGMATVFFYAQLWRRSGVMTDLEFYEIRYSGKAASFVRGFRSIYLGLFFNCIIMASVNLAACKIANVLFGIKMWQTLVFCGALNVVFACHSGLWGVLIIDMIQFFIMMISVILVAFFALQAPGVNGLNGLIEKLSNPMLSPDGHTINYLNFLPDFGSNWDIAIAIFIMPIAVQWWAVWYPGSEPGGGSYIAQRMLASKTEKDSLGAVLFFNLAHYILRPWPWIITGLCSIIVYPNLSDIQIAFPNMDSRLLGHDIAYPAMLKFVPIGFFGFIIAGLIAAYSSTILTQMNWGASYLVHDFYRRFINKGSSERHYVWAGRIVTVFIFIAASLLTLILDSAKDTFDLMLQVGAGTGLLYLIRWFWWRVNAWCEITAMVSSFLISIVLFILNKNGVNFGTAINLLITVLITTLCWTTVAFVGPKTDIQVLVQFYKKIKPFGPGWNYIKSQSGLSAEDTVGTGENIPLGLLGWMSGCITVWSALFTLGNLLYGRMIKAIMLGGVFVVSGILLLYVINKLWSTKKK